MYTLLLLLSSDLRYLKGWFGERTGSKGIVIGCFLVLFAAIYYGIYLFSELFFNNLATYENFGYLTALYIINSSIVALLWFISSVQAISTITSFLESQKEMTLLRTLPISSKVLALWVFVKNSIVGFFLFLVLLFPMLLAFGNAFSKISPLFFSSSILSLLILAILCNSIGGLIGYILLPIVRRRKELSLLLGFVLFVLSSLFVLRFIFPRSLYQLYRAEPYEFQGIYESLPLINQYLPSYHISQFIGNGFFGYFLLIAGVAGAVAFIAIQIENFLFDKASREQSNVHSASFLEKLVPRSLLYSYPLEAKEFIKITRKTSELGYGAFLILMTLFFFLFVLISGQMRNPRPGFEGEITTFLLIWVLFFAAAYFLRMTFPLVAEEGKNIWYIFTKPFPLNQLIAAKILFALVLSIPFLLIPVFVWSVAAPSGLFMILSVLSISAILTLTFVNVLLGTVYPNFKMGNFPEKVSTSPMGIVALAVSFVIVSYHAVFCYRLIEGTAAVSSIVYITVLNMMVIIVLGGISFLVSKRYQF